MSASAPIDNPIILDVTQSLGFMVIGTVFACVLWGVSCMQAFMYYVDYPDDQKLLKVLIGALWAMDTAGVILLVTGIWPPLISHWGSIAVLSGGLPDIVHHTWVAGVLSTCVQLLFVWRIYKLGGYIFKWLIPIVLVVLCLYQLATSIAFAVIGLEGHNLAALSTPTMKALQISNRGCTVASDILICACLLRILIKRGLPSFSSSRKMISRLIIVTINSGLWTAIFATISLILMKVQPDGFGYTIVELPIGSLYLTSLLSNLNARQYIRGRETEWNEYLSTLSAAPNSDSSAMNAHSAGSNDAIVFTTFNRSTDVEYSNGHDTIVGSGLSRKDTDKSSPYLSQVTPV
ncbi:hypothetical protein BDZ89DRAFT_1086982 [Hymenopellis radicata]|nr:hypothetical protein BDZ89DRAFT_1086982 [Hymenopellis radicata]